MVHIQTKLNKYQYRRLLDQCEKLKESEYEYIQKAVTERIERNEPLTAKIKKWMIDDHDF